MTFHFRSFKLVLLATFLVTALFTVLFTTVGSAQTAPAQVVPPVTVTVNVPETDAVHWILPGPRALDPAVFGTPEMPLGFENAPDVGVALENRLTENGAYTTTQEPTAHSNNVAMTSGSVTFTVTDVTAVDNPQSMDAVSFESTFNAPGDAGDTYRVVVDKVIPVGPHHTFFGGVLTNAFLHGGTGIGTSLQPQQFVYAGFWGVGQLFKNDEVVADNQVVHVMLSQRVRTAADEGYELVFSDAVNELPGQQIHVILPPTTVTPDGPQDRPVPTGFTLQNGEEQPFLHLMFDEVGTVSGSVAN